MNPMNTIRSDVNTNLHFAKSGITQHYLSPNRRVVFNSLFLAQYDSHYNAIQQIFMHTYFFKLLQTTMPDTAITLTDADAWRITVSPYAYYKKLAEEHGELSLDRQAPESAKLETMLKLLHRFRYRKMKNTSKHLHVFMDQKFSGSGLIKSGRYVHNFRRNIRFGAFVRTSVWAFYTGAFLHYSPLTSADEYSRSCRYTTLNLSKHPSAFFRRRATTVHFDKSFSRQTLLFTMLSAVTALRTVWFRTAKHLHMSRITNTDAGALNFANFKHHEMLRFGFRQFGRFRVAPAGANNPGGVDIIIQQRLARRDSNLKHHARRIGFTWYEKKLWGYSKNHRYWRYMQWVAHFYFRGLAYHRLFYMRLDVFLVYHLRVRNIRHARLLIKGRHAFIGDTACLHANQPINPMTVVSISKYARGWLNFNFNKLSMWRRAKSKNLGLLVFGRYFENAYLYGPGYIFAIPYGDPLDILWAKRAGKSGFFAFSYYQGQKTISSAWW